MLRRKCSEQVSYSVAVGPAETNELIAELPDGIRKDLLESLKQENVLLRYDAPSRCAYYIAREHGDLVVWLWCDMGLRAAGTLLTAVVEVDEPMHVQLALALYDHAMAQIV